jgi:MoxR-like ATPase
MEDPSVAPRVGVATAPEGWDVLVNGSRRGRRVEVAAGDELSIAPVLPPEDSLEYARGVEGAPRGGIFSDRGPGGDAVVSNHHDELVAEKVRSDGGTFAEASRAVLGIPSALDVRRAMREDREQTRQAVADIVEPLVRAVEELREALEKDRK